MMVRDAYSPEKKVTASQEDKNHTVNITKCLFTHLEAFSIYPSWQCHTVQDGALIKFTVVVLVCGDSREQQEVK